MKIFRSLDDIARAGARSTVTIGNFDGIHCAHQELLRRVRERASARGVASTAVTFDPHPVAILAPERTPKLLTPLAVRVELMARGGIDRLLILPFTREMSEWPPERFVEEVLVKALRAEGVLVGDNFHFGHRAAGTPRTLEELGRRFGFATEILPKMVLRGRIVSSSQIRSLLEEGRVAPANRLLGHPFFVRGPVEAGHGIGRAQTVPTFNLGETGGLLPREGVYVTLTRCAPAGGEAAAPASTSYESVTNVGRRPTFGKHGLGVETHLLGGPPEQHPQALDVLFLHRLRDERKFDSPEELKRQIFRDVERARGYFRRLRRAGLDPCAA